MLVQHGVLCIEHCAVRAGDACGIGSCNCFAGAGDASCIGPVHPMARLSGPAGLAAAERAIATCSAVSAASACVPMGTAAAAATAATVAAAAIVTVMQ